ncbi:hypothetical protein BKP30_27070 [Rhodococcus erythropolis]|nr:hypothetical protein BKP30_27070 [Rhodococcus erythropolis]
MFCGNATSKNVTTVVTVLMISCQVSIVPSRKNDGAQNTTITTHTRLRATWLCNKERSPRAR